MTSRQKLFSLWFLQGLAATAWLIMLPKSTVGNLFGGYSGSRLALYGASFFLATGSALLFVFHNKLPPVSGRMHRIIFINSILVAISSPLVLFVFKSLGENSEYLFTIYYIRLAPFFVWLTLSAAELAVFQFFNYRDNNHGLTSARIHPRIPLVFIGIILIIAILIAITGAGITRTNDGSWGTPTTPVLEWQILSGIIAALVFLSLEKHFDFLRKDSVTALIVYGFTCVIWLATPIRAGFFATPPRAPNFEIYPFSDALIYAQYAQSALVGNGFLWPDVPTRPLYITFLTWLHFLAGQNYLRVIFLQTLVLAAFPVILYFLGKELAGRPIGLGLAWITIFRDLTTNAAAPFALNYSYSKLYFSEIPAALLLSLFTLIVLKWLKKSQAPWFPLAAGGILGLSALVRLQSLVFLAAVIPIGFYAIKEKKRWLTGSLLMVLGVILALTPWVLRNYVATGGLVLDNPISQTMVLARRWSGNNGNDLIPHLPGENEAQYSSRMAGLAWKSLSENPEKILGSANDHFWNNEIGNLLIFPLRDQLKSPSELIWPKHAFWQTWNGQPGPGQVFLILLYIIFLGLGLAWVYQGHRLIGLLPLILSLFYNAGTALFLSSGDRFLLPVDWAVYMYSFAGMFTLANLIFNFNTLHASVIIENKNPKQASKQSGKIAWVVGLVIFLIGSSLPLTEMVFPRQFNEPIQSLSPSNQGEILVRGRAIYPRWYDAGEGEPGTAKLGYGKMDQARLVFFLVGNENTLVIYPVSRSPSFFPNASDVTVTGVLEDGYLLAKKVSLQAEKQGK